MVAIGEHSPRAQPECADENAVVDFLQGRMSPAARGALEVHVDCCASCRRVLSAMLRTDDPRATGAIFATGSHPGSLGVPAGR